MSSNTFKKEVESFPGHVLLDMARNESASPEWRRAAIEIMLDKGYPQVNHPELRLLVLQIKSERVAKEEVQAVVETAVEQTLDAPTISCGVTTATMYKDE